MEQHSVELRRIRITLIIMTIILIFTGGGGEVILNNQPGQPPSHFNETVPLQDGHFGIISYDAIWEDEGVMKIYYYDPDTNELTLKKELPLEELPYE